MSGSFDRNVSCEVMSPTNEESNRSTAIPWTEIMVRFEPVHVSERSSAEPSPMKKTNLKGSRGYAQEMFRRPMLPQSSGSLERFQLLRNKTNLMGNPGTFENEKKTPTKKCAKSSRRLPEGPERAK